MQKRRDRSRQASRLAGSAVGCASARNVRVRESTGWKAVAAAAAPLVLGLPAGLLLAATLAICSEVTLGFAPWAGGRGVALSQYLLGPPGGELSRWLRSHGGWVNAFAADLPGDGPQRGLVAAYGMRRGSLALFVPNHLGLRAAATNATQGDGDAWRCAWMMAKLAVRLWAEQHAGSASPWHPWLRAILPDNPDALGIAPFLTAQDRELAMMMAPSYPEAAQLAFGLARDMLASSPYDEPDDAQLKRLIGIVMSRSAGFCGDRSIDGIREELSLCPLVDMANMASPPKRANAELMDVKGGRALYVLADIRAGEEIMIDYGEFSNAELLLVYGFTLPGNDYVGQPFELVPSGAPPACGEVLRELQDLRLTPKGLPTEEPSKKACLQNATLHGGGTLAEACLDRAQALHKLLHAGVTLHGGLEQVAQEEQRALLQCAS